jgi:antirestriction protein
MEAKIYVGTYGKYNGGSIKGAWLDLTKYADKKAFVKACKKLHKGEHDSEKAYAEYLAGEMGYYAAMKKAGLNECYFDEEAYARDLFMGDYFYSDGVVYRNI